MRKTIILIASVLAFACTRGSEAVPPPMMGWSSWNAFMTDISDTLIIQQGEMMKSLGLADAGYEYINIDDGHFGFRDSLGNMTPNPLRFPGGMRAVTDSLHSLGLKAGIYSDAGDNTCGSSYNSDIWGFGAGLYSHDIQDAQVYFNDWNFDFIKIDFCGGSHLKLSPRERYLRIRQVIDSVSTHPVEINICRWHYPGTWVSEAGNSWRISGDIAPEWRFIKYIMGQNMYLSAYAGGGKYNDMDMLVVGYGNKPSGLLRGKGLSFAEEEAHFALWCFMTSPLLLGCDLAYLPEDTRELITNPELISLNQDPLGVQPYVVQHEGEGYVLVKDIKCLRGRQRAVALYNPSEETLHFEVPLETLELAGSVKVRDVVRREDLGKMEILVADVPAHYARVFSLKGEKRLDPSVLEAEWAYIPAYNDLGTSGGKYVTAEGASCGVAVSNLGGLAENCLQWRNVFRKKGGIYNSILRYSSSEDCEVILNVNGVADSIILPQSEGFADKEIALQLRKGANAISIESPEHAIPVLIDAIIIDTKN